MIVHNKQQQFAMPNLRMAAKTLCRPDDIYMAVDGDDELLGRQVFKFFNSRFQAK